MSTGRATSSRRSRPTRPTREFLFASSLDVFGHNPNPPPRRLTDPIEATDAYTEAQGAGEEMVRESGLSWSIFRYADVPQLALRPPVPTCSRSRFRSGLNRCTRSMPVSSARQGGHEEETWGKAWLVGGGQSCQLKYGDYLARFFAAMEMGGPLPEAAFSEKPYCTDWLDTEESERVFDYQRHSFEDIVRDVAALLGWRRSLARLSQPVVREYMLGMSPYYRKRREGS